MPGSQALEVVRGTAQAASLFAHPLRLKLLEYLSQPDSASGLSRRLGVPRQVLNSMNRHRAKSSAIRDSDVPVRSGESAVSSWIALFS